MKIIIFAVFIVLFNFLDQNYCDDVSTDLGSDDVTSNLSTDDVTTNSASDDIETFTTTAVAANNENAANNGNKSPSKNIKKTHSSENNGCGCSSSSSEACSCKKKCGCDSNKTIIVKEPKPCPSSCGNATPSSCNNTNANDFLIELLDDGTGLVAALGNNGENAFANFGVGGQN